MVKKLRRAFTITELVIVIAVIAILAAVLIPTFTSLIDRANRSVDEQAVTQMNTVLNAEAITDGKPKNVAEVQECLRENGINNFNASSTSCYFYWIEEDNSIIIWEQSETDEKSGKVVYPSNMAEKYAELTEIPEQKYLLSITAATSENFADILSQTDSVDTVITLVEDIVLERGIEIKDNSVTVDLGGNTITTTGKDAYDETYGEQIEGANGFYLWTETVSNQNIVLRNGTIKSSDFGGSPIVVSYSANENTTITVTMENMTIESKNSGIFNLNESSPVYAVSSNCTGAKIIMKNCTVTGSLNFTDCEKVEITGGRYTAVNGNGDESLFYTNLNNIFIDGATLNLQGLKLVSGGEIVQSNTTVNE